jgi:hypothetical protein
MDILKEGFPGKKIHRGIYFVMKELIVGTEDTTLKWLLQVSTGLMK